MKSEYEIIKAAETLVRYLCWEEPTCKNCLLHDMCDNTLRRPRSTATICRSFTEEVRGWDNEDWTKRRLEAAKRDLEKVRWQMSRIKEDNNNDD